MDDLVAEAAVAVGDARNGLVHLIERESNVLEHRQIGNPPTKRARLEVEFST